MNPSPSPPQEAEHIRHQQLTPESPRPQNVPSPANIPILELQMDPNFHESSHNNDTSTTPAAQPAAHHSQTGTLLAPSPYYPDPSTAAHHQSVGVQGAGGDLGMQMQAHDTLPASIQNYSAQHQQSRAASSSDATLHQTSTPGQDSSYSAYPFAHDNAYAVQQAPLQAAQGAHFQPEGNAATSVDVQALLDSLTPAALKAAAGQYAAPQMSPQSAQAQAQPNAFAAAMPSAPSLPARPPAQDHLTTHPNYTSNGDIRSFHPHSQQSPTTQQPSGNGQVQHLNVPGQGYATMRQGGAQSPTSLGSAQKRHQAQRSETPDDEDSRWPPEVNKRYEEFLDQERKFVTEGQWDQFPMGSRLFIGNLPTEKVTKRDIFHRFHRHGQLAQISIKQAYGFVQFLDSESCRRALDAEQGQAVRGRKMHLEVSKPQKNSRKAEPQNTAAPRRRSRSPDYTRGGTMNAPRDGRPGGGQGPMSPRDRDRRFRDREEYRPMRSPSPRGNARGMRSRDRSRDRFDSRYRSRSRTPPRRRRSPSPRQDYTEDDLDLRRRLPHEVPDIQILVLNEGISRDFIRYVEDIFRQQGLRSNVLIMSGRFPEPAVVRRQIIEGVLAIVRMDTSGFMRGKVSVQIFDRRGGANNVQFNEYADLDPPTTALLVNNAKQTQSQPVQPPTPAFGFNRNMPPFNQPPQNPFASASASQPNMTNIISSLDPASLSQLLGAMSSGNTPQNQQPPPDFNANLARLLAQVSSPAQTPGFSTTPHAQMPQLNHFPGLAAMLANQAQSAPPPAPSTSQPGGAQPDMSEIMAQLAQYQR
ncbi:hypothetical protein DE146DRAFT_127235 [Phaeosphaeria sp. MPI-PUGE-AT-0046c]|nr:hypothetical protein DE146DRAFT_127235 [Phaeosphaeria sp. MPI-PUGE-AT-0046c]